MASAEPIPKQIEEMVRTWANHAAIPFQMKKRSKEAEYGIRMAILMAFQALGGSIPQVKGVRFGYSWDEENHISVSVAPSDELTDDMLIIKVGEKINAHGDA